MRRNTTGTAFGPGIIRAFAKEQTYFTVSLTTDEKESSLPDDLQVKFRKIESDDSSMYVLVVWI